MKTIQVLESKDIIKPDDLVLNKEKRWEYAKFSIPGWVGKMRGAYQDALIDAKLTDEKFLMIRVPSKIDPIQLEKLGISIHLHSAGIRTLCGKANGKLGNKNLYPKPVKFTFGRFKGRTIEEIYYEDKYYLEWFLDNHDLTKEVKDLINDWLRGD